MSPLALALDPGRDIAAVAPLALAEAPVAMLRLLRPLALAFAPVAMLSCRRRWRWALTGRRVYALAQAAGVGLGPAGDIEALPAAVAFAPLAVVPTTPSPTAAPSEFPTQTNCAAAGRGASVAPTTIVTMAQPANSAARCLLRTFDMTSPV